jgi:hypothetical protein
MQVKPDYGNPSVIAPIYDMPIEGFKEHLVTLRTPMNPHSTPSFRPTDNSVGKDCPRYVSALPLSVNQKYQIRFIHRALADVANARSLGPNWSALSQKSNLAGQAWAGWRRVGRL